MGNDCAHPHSNQDIQSTKAIPTAAINSGIRLQLIRSGGHSYTHLQPCATERSRAFLCFQTLIEVTFVEAMYSSISGVASYE